MNYYSHHIGDYLSATAHLTLLEHGAYRRLIDLYYTHEAPLPADLSQVCRLVGARTPEERQAVEDLLREFFVQGEDGRWHQSRCDYEISRCADGEPARKAKAEHEAERIKRHRDERAAIFEKLRQLNVHPAWNTPINELRKLLPLTEPATEPATLQATDSVTPLTATLSPNHPITPTPHQSTKSTPLAPSDESLEAKSVSKAVARKPNGSDPTPVVERIPLVGDSEFEVHQSAVHEWERLFPAVDIPQTLKEIRAWNLANPRNRKTTNGVMRHITQWLAKEQNKPDPAQFQRR